MKFMIILNILASRKRLNIFEVLKKKWGSIRPGKQRVSRQWDSEMTQKLLFLKHNLIFGIEIYIFIHYNLSIDKIDPKDKLKIDYFNPSQSLIKTC